MIIKVCDRCKKQIYPKPSSCCAKLFRYNITVTEGLPPEDRKIDLCNECQDDFNKWMKEKLDNGEGNDKRSMESL